ncbi:MAG TPA: c-type cytochrome [Kofleriaceae bacterium]|nr:c-type cytochrome [Kofleriaceae bacterium]
MLKNVAFVIVLYSGCSSPSSASNSPPIAPEPVAKARPADAEKIKADLFAAETAAYDKAKPAFQTYCAGCHTKSGKKATRKKLDHFDMTTYPFGGEHAKSIGNEIRVVLAIDGAKKPSMPEGKPGSVKPDDLAAIKAWTVAWQAAGAAGVHPADPADKDDD